MRFLIIALIPLSILGLSTLCIVRPAIAINWAKKAHPEYAGDGAEIVWVVKLIGIGGVFIGLYIVALVVRAVLY
jgi:hypothetical protein